MTLKSMREQAGLTQQDLLAAIGSHSISRIWAWEAWDRSPRPRTARRAADRSPVTTGLWTLTTKPLTNV